MLIFAIDDEPNMLYLLHEAIAEAAPEAVIEDFTLASTALERIAAGVRPDVVFSDIEMPGMLGLELAARLKQLVPETKIVYVTGYDYAMEAYRLHVNGYLSKPVEADRVREELEVLFPHRTGQPETDRLRVQCFGRFEVFWNNEPLAFSRKQTKELLAYLVDRRGALCSSDSIIAALWEEPVDFPSARHRVWNLTSDLRASLKAIGMEEVLVSRGKQLAVKPDLIDCDYYHLLEGDTAAREAFRGEYMEQYSWAEPTKASLLSRFPR